MFYQLRTWSNFQLLLFGFWISIALREKRKKKKGTCDYFLYLFAWIQTDTRFSWSELWNVIRYDTWCKYLFLRCCNARKKLNVTSLCKHISLESCICMHVSLVSDLSASCIYVAALILFFVWLGFSFFYFCNNALMVQSPDTDLGVDFCPYICLCPDEFPLPSCASNSICVALQEPG